MLAAPSTQSLPFGMELAIGYQDSHDFLVVEAGTLAASFPQLPVDLRIRPGDPTGPAEQDLEDWGLLRMGFGLRSRAAQRLELPDCLFSPTDCDGSSMEWFGLRRVHCPVERHRAVLMLPSHLRVGSNGTRWTWTMV